MIPWLFVAGLWTLALWPWQPIGRTPRRRASQLHLQNPENLAAGCGKRNLARETREAGRYIVMLISSGSVAGDQPRNTQLP